MKTAVWILGSSLLLAGSAFGNTYVKCGTQVDPTSGEVQGYELELSTEGADLYQGPVGGHWNMKLHSEDSEWLAANKNITAKTSKSGSDTIVEIKIKQAQGASGPVGTQYKLIGLFDDSPRLEKYTMGGFAGTVLVGKYECVSGND